MRKGSSKVYFDTRKPVEHKATVTRRGSGWGFRCSCGHEPNVSAKQRRVAEQRAKDHERSDA